MRRYSALINISTDAIFSRGYTIPSDGRLYCVQLLINSGTSPASCIFGFAAVSNLTPTGVLDATQLALPNFFQLTNDSGGSGSQLVNQIMYPDWPVVARQVVYLSAVAGTTTNFSAFMIFSDR